MTALAMFDDDPTPEVVPPQRLVAIVSTSGWWALYMHKVKDKPEWRTTRIRVAAWAQFAGGVDGWNVVALVVGDTDQLVPAHEALGPRGREDYPNLWHDGDSYCECSRSWHHPSTTDDVSWCEECAGVIEER